MTSASESMSNTYEKICVNCEQPFHDGDKITFVRGEFVHDRCEKSYRQRIQGLIYRCPVCKGVGALSKEPRPVVEIVGWELDEE